ncbi:uncharacterized protein FIBRA_01260 [Fibroporia radiculosa]|uniref:peptidyl-tRNA hydrolase n=1 Tax=Fibroporia radiculosa TaxID=599839 RepID=J4GJQ1_9APHY|nr:uncharacterized protein FIBRA_01260 [Fibroporia radiculosa]CCL99245.1 predicted protein [Fibroporia radiculosa]
MRLFHPRMSSMHNSPVVSSAASTPPLVMQIVVRRDLLDAEGWGVGPLMAQVAHATAAVLHETRDHPDTQVYLQDLTNMRKLDNPHPLPLVRPSGTSFNNIPVLCRVDDLPRRDQTADEGSIQRLSSLLTASDPPIPHHLWIEQPENVPTCLALAPNRRDSKIKRALDKGGCRLWKG